MKGCSYKFIKIHKKRPEACNFIKKETLAQVFSCSANQLTGFYKMGTLVVKRLKLFFAL